MPELDSEEDTARQNEVPFIGIGNEDNKDQYVGLLATTQLGGITDNSKMIGDEK